MMTDQEILQRAIEILDGRLKERSIAMQSPLDTKNYLRIHLSELEYESFRIMLLDNQHRLIRFKEMFRGTIDGASVHPREVVKAALAFNAAAVIFTHNHPSGVAEPSQADQRITERLISALRLVDVRVLDHIIVGDQENYSFAEHGLL